MTRVLLFVVGVLGLLLVWMICGPVWLSDAGWSSQTMGLKGDPVLWQHYIEFPIGSQKIISIAITPWTKLICAALSIIYTVLFGFFTASLFRRRN